jgi:hypothetical protein
MNNIDYSALFEDVTINSKLLKKKRKNNKYSSTNAKQLLEDHGNIYVYALKREHIERIYVCRIKEVNFILDEDLFKRGRQDKGTDGLDINNIPNMNFWYQRYYFYSRFDEGIKMDNESI